MYLLQPKRHHRNKLIVTSIFIFNFLQGIVSLRNNFLLTIEQQHILSCIKNIIEEFPPEQPLLVSTSLDITHYENGTKQQQLSYVNLVDAVLASINSDSCWSVKVSSPDVVALDSTFSNVDKKQYNYIIFIGRDQETDDVLTNLVYHIEEIKAQASLNTRTRFLVVVTDTGTHPPSSVALTILKELFTSYMILNVLVLVPETQYETVPCDTDAVHKLLLYTWFPYHKSGERVVLLNAWLIHDEGRFLKESNMFPKKLPTTFSNYTVRISTYEYKPYMVHKGTYVNEKNITWARIEGPQTDCLKLVLRHLNMSYYYIPPPNASKTMFTKVVECMAKLSYGEADVALGLLPLNEHFIDLFDFTDPYLVTGFKWYVPCPRPYPRLQRVYGIFHASLWLIMGLSLLLIAAVTWRLGKRTQETESSNFRSFFISLLNIWAIMIGVSVPEIPRTSLVRVIFALYVWYSYVISTVFQTYFTSYLVDPGDTAQIRSFDELLFSGLEYGYHNDYNKYYQYSSDKTDWRWQMVVKNAKEVLDYKESLLRVIQKGDFASLRLEINAEFFVTTTFPKRKKILCSLDGTFSIVWLNVYFPKNSPFLEIVNSIIVRLVQAGITDKFLRDFKETWRYHVSPNAQKYELNSTDTDFVIINTEHLLIGFYVLLYGYGCSFLLFLMELMYHKLIVSSSTNR